MLELFCAESDHVCQFYSSNLQEACSNITTVIHLQNRGHGVWRQVQGKWEAQQLAAQQRHTVVAHIHLKVFRTTCSKQVKTAGDIKQGLWTPGLAVPVLWERWHKGNSTLLHLPVSAQQLAKGEHTFWFTLGKQRKAWVRVLGVHGQCGGKKRMQPWCANKIKTVKIWYSCSGASQDVRIYHLRNTHQCMVSPLLVKHQLFSKDESLLDLNVKIHWHSVE